MDRPPSSETNHQRPRKKRRTRVSKACDEYGRVNERLGTRLTAHHRCRIRKIRCDGGQPCEPCEAFERRQSSHHLCIRVSLSYRPEQPVCTVPVACTSSAVVTMFARSKRAFPGRVSTSTSSITAMYLKRSEKTWTPCSPRLRSSGPRVRPTLTLQTRGRIRQRCET